MGLDSELRYRKLIQYRRNRWNRVCQLSTRLLDSNINTSTDNEVILRVITALNGLKASPRGSFDRLLIRELNNLEKQHSFQNDSQSSNDSKIDISCVLKNLINNSSFMITREKSHFSNLLYKNELFIEAVRSLPITLDTDFYSNINSPLESDSIELSVYRRNLEKIKFYLFFIGLFTLTQSAASLSPDCLRSILHTVYYFSSQATIYPYSWLTDQLQLNYPKLLSDYPDHIISIEGTTHKPSHMNAFKEALIELCRPLIISIYHDLFLNKWHLLYEEPPDIINDGTSLEVFCNVSDSRVLVGLTGHDVTHSISIDLFNNLWRRFDSASVQSTEKNFSVFNGPIGGDYPEEFCEKLWVMLTRYDSITDPSSKNMQSSIPKAVSDFACNVLKCDLECFASPLNVQSKYYCSLFTDTDAPFGSFGNFFEYVKNNMIKNHSCILINPPFELKILEKTVEVALEVSLADVVIKLW